MICKKIFHKSFSLSNRIQPFPTVLNRRLPRSGPDNNAGEELSGERDIHLPPLSRPIPERKKLEAGEEFNHIKDAPLKAGYRSSAPEV